MDKTTFKEITAAILSVPSVRWVDFDLGQLEQEAPPVSYPCVLVGLGQSPVYQQLGTVDQVELSITVRVAFKLYERTHSVNADVYRNAALEHLDTLANIHAALNGLSGTNFNAIGRIGYWANERRADIRVYSATYQTLLTDEGEGAGPEAPDPQYIPWSEIPIAAPELCTKIGMFASLHGIEIDWVVETDGGVVG